MGTSFYKVTSVKISNSEEGDNIFYLQLNGEIWIKKFSSRKSDFVGGETRKLDLSMLVQYSKERIDKFHYFRNRYLTELYYGNNKSLDILIGKYIVGELVQDKYGIDLKHITSYDLVNDFKSALDSCNGRPITIGSEIYHFLMMHKYPMDSLDTIRLKKPYNDYVITLMPKLKPILKVFENNEKCICYYKKIGENLLTLDNIEYIYQKFYAHLKENTSDGDDSYYYKIQDGISIVKMVRRIRCSNKMTTSGDYDRWDASNIFEIGSALSKEQIEYLNTLK